MDLQYLFPAKVANLSGFYLSRANRRLIKVSGEIFESGILSSAAYSKGKAAPNRAALQMVGQVGLEPTMFQMSRIYSPLQSPTMLTAPYGGECRTRTQCCFVQHTSLSKRVSDLPSSLSIWLGWMDSNHRCRLQRLEP